MYVPLNSKHRVACRPFSPPTLERFLMIAILCIDSLYSWDHHAENAKGTNAAFSGDIMVPIIGLGAMVVHIRATLSGKGGCGHWLPVTLTFIDLHLL